MASNVSNATDSSKSINFRYKTKKERRLASNFYWTKIDLYIVFLSLHWCKFFSKNRVILCENFIDKFQEISDWVKNQNDKDSCFCSPQFFPSIASFCRFLFASNRRSIDASKVQQTQRKRWVVFGCFSSMYGIFGVQKYGL